MVHQVTAARKCFLKAVSPFVSPIQVLHLLLSERTTSFDMWAVCFHPSNDNYQGRSTLCMPQCRFQDTRILFRLSVPTFPLGSVWHLVSWVCHRMCASLRNKTNQQQLLLLTSSKLANQVRTHPILNQYCSCDGSNWNKTRTRTKTMWATDSWNSLECFTVHSSCQGGSTANSL